MLQYFGLFQPSSGIMMTEFPGFISDVSTQMNSNFSIVLGLYMECFEKNAFSVEKKYLEKHSFSDFPL